MAAAPLAEGIRVSKLLHCLKSLVYSSFPYYNGTQYRRDASKEVGECRGKGIREHGDRRYKGNLFRRFLTPWFVTV